ncbi:MAG: hypothetical protein HWD61_07555 [Parachlamydiaceae bacterium]|nr:MAG: hypothetical protein HWD61_07555 [Parachlamydiaceae bacterium]
MKLAKNEKGEIVLKEKSKQFLNRYFGFLFKSGRSQETQAALAHILKTIDTEIENGNTFYLDEKIDPNPFIS